jgi:hypothetical protein
MFARHAHLWSRFSEFNAEDTEKCHREHRGPHEKEFAGMQERGRPISLWFSVILSVLCVALFGIQQ